MGKKGDLLRQQKAQSAKYTFTAAQLQEHDRMILQAKKEEIKREVTAKVEAEYADKEKHIEEVIQQEWDKRAAQFQSGSKIDDFTEIMSCLLSLSARVLVEKFGWKPLPKDAPYDKRNHLMKFSDALVDELNRITEDELLDIRKYNNETYELYGVKFGIIEEEVKK